MLKQVNYWILFVLYTFFVLFTDAIYDIIPKLLFPQGLAFRPDQPLPANYIPKVLTTQGLELLFYVQRIVILLFIIMYPLNYRYHSNDIIEFTKKPYRRFIEIWTMMITGAISYHLILSRLARNFVDGKIIITLFDNRAYVIYEYTPSFPFLAVMDSVLNEAYFLIFDAAAFIIIISFLILNNSDSSENLLFPEIDPSDESLNEHIMIDSSKSQLFPSITNSFILVIVGMLTYFLLNFDTLLIQQTIEQYAAMDTLNTYILINYIIIIGSIPDMIILLGGFYFVYNVIFTKFETFQYGLKSGIKFFIIRWC